MDAAKKSIVERNLLIEQLIDPLTRQRRNEAFGMPASGPIDLNSLRPPAFVHYTSSDAAISIIKNKSIWMRNATCMDDWSEVTHGHQILTNFFNVYGKRDAFFEACNKIFDGSGLETLQRFDGWWKGIQFGTYIASVSEHDARENHHGRLSMWRAFGCGASRVAMIFRPPSISGALDYLEAQMRPVLYNSEAEIHLSLDEMIDNIDLHKDFFFRIGREMLINMLFSRFIGLAVGLKHSAFAEEREWRIIYIPKLQKSSRLNKNVESVRGNPQIVYKFPLQSNGEAELSEIEFGSMFERLIIGPTVYSWALYEAFVELLSNAGVVSAAEKVWVSGIPLR